MFCARCGASNLDFDQFCKSCSSPLTKPGGAYGAGAAPGIPQQPNPYSNPYSSAGPVQQQPPPNPYSNPYSSAGPAPQQPLPPWYTPYPGHPGGLHPQQYNSFARLIMNIGRPGASGRATASMFLSVISAPFAAFSILNAFIFLCGFPVSALSILGMILGKMEMDAIRQGKAPQAGETRAKVGFYVGLVSTILLGLAVVISLLQFISIVMQTSAS